MYEISYNARISDNTFVGNAWGRGLQVPGFPSAAIYVSESGGDSRVPSHYSGMLLITGNVLRTNWGGVVLWENANRYCGDGSDHICTLVTPGTYTVASCQAHVHGSRPTQHPDYFAGCRWMTKTVIVTRNSFIFTPTKIPRCAVWDFCGFNGLFSEYGSIAPWKGWVVPLGISDRQNNCFKVNRYTGPWHFDGFNQGDTVGWRAWTRGFADLSGSHDRFRGQDKGSTLRP